MRSRPMLLAANVLALIAPLAALAQQAQTARWAHLRAGPAREYPLVAQLPPNAPVAVQGCLSDYSWCDVVTPYNERGWIYGGNLVYPYQNGSVPIVQYGATIGVPVVTFILGSYWGSYYSERPWYGDWHRWDRWNRDRYRPARPGRPDHRPPPPPHRPDFRPPRPPGVQPPPSRPPGPPVMRPPIQPPMVRPAPPPQRPPANRPQPRPVMRGGEGERERQQR